MNPIMNIIRGVFGGQSQSKPQTPAPQESAPSPTPEPASTPTPPPPSQPTTPQPFVNDFEEIYHQNIFGSDESISGEGSKLGQTAILRERLPVIFRELNVRVLLDLPCGDFNWMKHTDLAGIHYIGGDVVKPLIESNREKYSAPEREFHHIDLINDKLPDCDLIFCRDCLVHLPYEHIFKAIANVKRSSATWLATTTFTRRHENSELYGVWRTLNLQDPPFSFPEPEHIIEEGCPPVQGLDFSDKSMAFWRVQNLPDLPAHQA